jgi:predicted transcriptional regulator
VSTKRNTKQQAPKTVVIGVRIETELVEQLKRIADEDDRSLSGAMRKIVKDHLTALAAA